jgi:hypothetical protein
MNPRYPSTALLVVFGFLVVLSGCRRPPPPASISAQTSVSANEPMRIAVLPFVLADGVGRSAHALDEAFSAALRTLGRHEVIGVPLEKARLLLPASAIERSVITADDLLRLRDALQVDAVVLGRVDQFTGFDPLAIGATAHLVAVTDGAVLWSATAELDAGRADVQNDVQWWHEHGNGSGNASLAGWRMTLSSPSSFARYVADRLVETIPMPAHANTSATADASLAPGP